MQTSGVRIGRRAGWVEIRAATGNYDAGDCSAAVAVVAFFLARDFFRATGFSAFFSAAAFCALTAAQRFFVASTMRFMPAALIRRFFGVTSAGAAEAFLTAAHLFF